MAEFTAEFMVAEILELILHNIVVSRMGYGSLRLPRVGSTSFPVLYKGLVRAKDVSRSRTVTASSLVAKDVSRSTTVNASMDFYGHCTSCYYTGLHWFITAVVVAS